MSSRVQYFVMTACMQLDCSAWQGQIAAALAASPSTPITPSLPQLTALLGSRDAEEAHKYAREAVALADQIPMGRWISPLHQYKQPPISLTHVCAEVTMCDRQSAVHRGGLAKPAVH